jgi:superfamily I DNA and RNA helicase
MIENHITLTTVYRAKGNEAGCVYIVGIDSIFSNKNSIVARNKLFTAITRAKAWVTITGVGVLASQFEKEIEAIVDNNYQLIFKMPDLNTLRKIQRDLANKQAKINEIRKYIVEQADELGIDPDELLKI